MGDPYFEQIYEGVPFHKSDCGCAKCSAKHTFEVHEDEEEKKRAKRKPKTNPDFQHGAITKAVASWDVLSKGGPDGGGWAPIPKGQKGGFRRGQAGSYEYWYPGQGSGKDAKPATHEQHFSVGDYNLTVVAQAQGSLSPEDVKRAKDIAKKMKSGIDKAADVCKMSPPVCQGNLGVPRMHMPQIMEKSIKEMAQSADPEDRKKAQAAIAAGADANSDVSIKDQFLAALKYKGVKISEESVPVGQLKATQREIKAGKTFGMADAFLRGKYKPQDAQIIVSSDNHILDGHHRWAALVTAAPDTKMKILRVDMPMKEFLQASFNQAGVFRADLQGDIVDPSIPLDLSGNDKSDVNYDAPSTPAPSAKEAAATKPDANSPQALGVTAKPAQDEKPKEPAGWKQSKGGYEGFGGRAKIDTKAKTVTVDGQKYDLPKKGASFDHAEGIVREHMSRGTAMSPEAKKESSNFASGKKPKPKKPRSSYLDSITRQQKEHEESGGKFVVEDAKTAKPKPTADKIRHNWNDYPDENALFHSRKSEVFVADLIKAEKDARKWAPIPQDPAGGERKWHDGSFLYRWPSAAKALEAADYYDHEAAEEDARAADAPPSNTIGTSGWKFGEMARCARRYAATISKSHYIKEQAMLFDPLDLVKGAPSLDEIEVRKSQVAQESFVALDADDLLKADADTMAMVRGPRTPPVGSRVRVGGVSMNVAPPAQLVNERSRPGMLPPQPVQPRQHDRSEVTGFTRAPDGTIMDPRSGLRAQRKVDTFSAE